MDRPPTDIALTDTDEPLRALLGGTRLVATVADTQDAREALATEAARALAARGDTAYVVGNPLRAPLTLARIALQIGGADDEDPARAVAEILARTPRPVLIATEADTLDDGALAFIRQLISSEAGPRAFLIACRALRFDIANTTNSQSSVTAIPPSPTPRSRPWAAMVAGVAVCATLAAMVILGPLASHPRGAPTSGANAALPNSGIDRVASPAPPKAGADPSPPDAPPPTPPSTPAPLEMAAPVVPSPDTRPATPPTTSSAPPYGPSVLPVGPPSRARQAAPATLAPSLAEPQSPGSAERLARLQRDFDSFLSRTGKGANLDAAQRRELFDEYLAWRASQSTHGQTDPSP